jgi:parallel beta-helix repeat protein
MQKGLLTLLALLLMNVIISAQTTFYVSSSEGNDNNSGTSPIAPWKSIWKLNNRSFTAGDKILFKSGDAWREQLNVASSGSSILRIEFGSYGTGNKPVIKGSERLSGFGNYSGNIWRYKTDSPQQVFFNSIRGKSEGSVTELNSDYEWYWSSGYLYVYSKDNPGTSIEVTSRRRGIYITGDYISISGLQIEHVTASGIEVTASALGVVIDNCTFYQWSNAIDGRTGAVTLNGSYSEVKNCIMGKNTGNDLADQGWSGFAGIVTTGKNNSVNNNKIFHTSLENEARTGIYAYGIYIAQVSGIVKVFKNYIYHVGSHGISTNAHTVSGDEIRIYENTIEYPGGAGISAYQTRAADGKGGKGYIYQNNISYSNRLGGDVGGAGNQSSGIHFNNGLRSTTDANKPYIKWYCYKNVVHDNMSLKVPNSPDACGISMDFNADGVEVFENLIYNNYSKGIEMWNANNCKVYYNLVYGNDAGINVTCMSGGVESAQNNQVYNNTCYKNYNGDAKGPNLHTEIFFGLRGKNNKIKNNILYAADEGYAYVYNVENTSGHELDNNIVYSENGYIARDGLYGKLNFTNWKAKRLWDLNSVNADPQFNNTANGDFSLKSTSPAINKGGLLGLLTDFLGKTLNGIPDIGAFEFAAIPESDPDPDTVPVPADSTVFGFNGMAAALSGDAHLGTMEGSKNTRPIYFDGTTGGITFSVDIPEAGKTWYAWARVYYMSKGGTRNSFNFNINGSSYVLGDDNEYDKWHWVGSAGSILNIGTLNKGTYKFSISGREPGYTLWVDQVVLTNNPGFVPDDNTVPVSNVSTVYLYNAMAGKLTGDARYGFMTGTKNLSCIFFKGYNGGVSFNVSIPMSGKKWYAWARMYYLSLGSKNSFFFNMNNSSYVLGDNDSKYNMWHWDGSGSKGINLGELRAGEYTFSISGREPGLTLWVDQVVITDDPYYDPNVLGKESTNENSETAPVNNIPAAYELSQNFPNPFNPATTIRYAVPENSQVTLKIFDILGAEVQTLVDEVKAPGYYEVKFDASNMASGVYICQLRTKDFVQAKKMNLLK